MNRAAQLATELVEVRAARDSLAARLSDSTALAGSLQEELAGTLSELEMVQDAKVGGEAAVAGLLQQAWLTSDGRVAAAEQPSMPDSSMHPHSLPAGACTPPSSKQAHLEETAKNNEETMATLSKSLSKVKEAAKAAQVRVWGHVGGCCFWVVAVW